VTLLVQAANIRHAYGGNQLFDDLSFEVKEGDRIALVGANGAGKSTLFKLMARQLVPDAGIVTHRRNLIVGYLTQEPDLDASATPRQTVALAAGDPTTLEAELRDLESRMETAADDEELATVLDAYGAALARLEWSAGPGHDVDAQVAMTLRGLGLPEDRWDRPIGPMSGGEQKLVGLARLVVAAPDLLLLDEPDNHLDEAAKAWLERFVAGYSGAVAVISHDRWFIDRAVNRIFELEDGQIEGYPGNYSAYRTEKQERLERRAQLRDLQEREFKKLKASAEQLTQWASQNPKFASRAENQRRKLAAERERLADTPPPVMNRRSIDVDLDAERGSTIVLDAAGLAKSYEGRTVLEPFDLVIRHGEAVGLVGGNGAGKTTLVRLALHHEDPTAGRIRMGPSVVPGYYAQQQETLDPAMTPMAVVRSIKPLTEQQALSFLVSYLFDRDDALNRIGLLSGGERARLQIAVLVLRGANFLLLDEPTNNLDLPSIEALETALLAFPGTILTISHDRYFLDRLCSRMLEVDRGVVRDYPGGFSYYDAHRGRGAELTIRPPEPAAHAGKPARNRRPGHARGT
jgi:ATP-binding cassette subfamily F protein 3